MIGTSNLERMRAIDEAWNAQDWQTYESLLAPDLAAHIERDNKHMAGRNTSLEAKLSSRSFPRTWWRSNRMSHFLAWTIRPARLRI
jgi:hypothetical protein